MDNVVRVVTTADRSTMTVAKPIPAWPTTHESRKYSITPHMLRRQPNNTPLIQPNLGAFNTLLFLTSMESVPASALLSSREAGGSAPGGSAYRKENHVVNKSTRTLATHENSSPKNVLTGFPCTNFQIEFIFVPTNKKYFIKIKHSPGKRHFLSRKKNILERTVAIWKLDVSVMTYVTIIIICIW